MGWSSALRGLGSGVRFRAGLKIGSSLKSFSSWLSTTKLSSWLKVGAAGGLGAVIYTGWTDAISSISDATGLSEENTSTIVLLVLGTLVVYIVVNLIRPKGGRGEVNVYIPENRRSSGRTSSRSSSRSGKSTGRFVKGSGRSSR